MNKYLTYFARMLYKNLTEIGLEVSEDEKFENVNTFNPSDL